MLILLRPLKSPILRSKLYANAVAHLNFRRTPILSQVRGMKRNWEATKSPKSSARKAVHVKVDDYCNTEPNRDENGNTIWPAPASQIVAARKFLREWYDSSNALVKLRFKLCMNNE